MNHINLNALNEHKISQSITKSLSKFADFFNNTPSDLIILLGDRYETLFIAIIARIFRIPIAHIHGGEKTNGSIDDNFRHALTKMSHFNITRKTSYQLYIIFLSSYAKGAH